MNMDVFVTHPCLKNMYVYYIYYIYTHHYDIMSISHLQSSSLTKLTNISPQRVVKLVADIMHHHRSINL